MRSNIRWNLSGIVQEWMSSECTGSGHAQNLLASRFALVQCRVHAQSSVVPQRYLAIVALNLCTMPLHSSPALFFFVKPTPSHSRSFREWQIHQYDKYRSQLHELHFRGTERWLPAKISLCVQAWNLTVQEICPCTLTGPSFAKGWSLSVVTKSYLK